MISAIVRHWQLRVLPACGRDVWAAAALLSFASHRRITFAGMGGRRATPARHVLAIPYGCLLRLKMGSIRAKPIVPTTTPMTVIMIGSIMLVVAFNDVSTSAS